MYKRVNQRLSFAFDKFGTFGLKNLHFLRAYLSPVSFKAIAWEPRVCLVMVQDLDSLVNNEAIAVVLDRQDLNKGAIF